MECSAAALSLLPARRRRRRSRRRGDNAIADPRDGERAEFRNHDVVVQYKKSNRVLLVYGWPLFKGVGTDSLCTPYEIVLFNFLLRCDCF